MGGGEGKLPHLRRSFPAAAGFCRGIFQLHRKRLKRDSVTGDRMSYSAKRFQFLGARVCDPQRIEFRDDALRLTEPRSGFDVRKFPKMCVPNSGSPLAHKIFSFVSNDEGDEVSRGSSFTFAELRQF